jgi:uncharacterized phage protein (TIGR02220 family)
MPRYSLNLSDEERDDLRRIAGAEDRSMASMMRVIFKSGLHVWKTASKQRQNSVEMTSLSRQNSAELTPDSPTPTPACAPASSSQRKKEEKKEKGNGAPRLCSLEISEQVIGELNRLTGQSIRPSAEGHRRLIQARLNAGATVEDLLRVVRVQHAEWGDSEKMSGHLVPKTLFKASNFENYVGKRMPHERKPRQTYHQEQRRKREAAEAARRAREAAAYDEQAKGATDPTVAAMIASLRGGAGKESQ